VLDGVDVVARDTRLGFAADAALAVGTAAAVPAAVTGLGDFRCLPGEIRRVGLTHAGLNSTSVVLSVASLLARRRGRRARGRALSLAAYAISASAAHLGGAMSFGLGERVNHDIETGTPDGFTAVLDDADLAAGQLVRVEVEGTPVLLTRASDGDVYAISNTCSHAGGPLNQGAREGDVVTCPWHRSRFDLCTGKVRQGPAVYPQRRFGTRVRDGRIEVGPPEQA
jgi:nitrite reductase/ring-hydroxylating ferredoxin subunit